jgi:hypothetical protein
MRTQSALIAAVAVACAVGALAPAANADWVRRAHREPAVGFVAAESRYSSQTIAAPVRISAIGRREVRLPGGTWIECHRSCSETLRRETIDFWYIRSNIDSTGNDGPGYLRFEFGW